MKFSVGFIAGAVVGGYIAANLTEQQRADISSRASSAVGKVRDSTIGHSLTSNATEVGEAASERVADAVDTAGTKLTEVVGSTATAT
jgi:hypothetical protein